MGIAARLALRSLGYRKSARELLHWINLLGQKLFRMYVSENLGDERPSMPYEVTAVPTKL